MTSPPQCLGRQGLNQGRGTLGKGKEHQNSKLGCFIQPKEQAGKFYQEHRGEEYFDDLTTTMSR